jgi:uncharacterized membrane protein HdeD (DUF308 family)
VHSTFSERRVKRVTARQHLKGFKTMASISKSITDQWWLVLLEGILAVAFGVIAWVWPDITVATLVILFGAYALATGLMNFYAAYAQHKLGASPWPFIFRGVVGVATGIIVAVWPDISAISLFYVVAAWALVSGVMALVSAIALRKVISNEWSLALAGIASIAFGVLAILYPGDGALALIWTIGIYAVFFGFMLIVLGFRLHSWGRQLTSATA